MHLQFLPQELISHIFSFCEVSTLKACRETCSSLSKGAEGFLFHHVTLYLCKDSLDKIRNIASTPHLARIVAVLSIEGDHNASLSKSVFRRRIIENEASQNYNPATTLEPQLSYVWRTDLKQINGPLYDWHQLLAKEAASMKSDASMSEAFLALFQSCRSLKTLRYSSGDSLWPPTHKHHSLFKRGYFLPFGTPDRFNGGIDIMKSVLIAAYEVDWRPKSLLMGDVSSFLLNDAGLKGSNILRSFPEQLEYLYWNIYIPCLDATLVTKGDENYQLLQFIDTGVTYNYFLQYASQLRRLEIIISYEYIEYGPRVVALPQLSSFVAERKWPLLEVFKIARMKCRSYDLSDFLLRHSTSIREVQLEELELSQGEWPDVFKDLKGRLGRLQKLELYGAFKQYEPPPAGGGHNWYTFSYGSKDDYATEIFDYIMDTNGPVQWPSCSSDETTSYNDQHDDYDYDYGSGELVDDTHTWEVLNPAAQSVSVTDEPVDW